MGRHDWYRRTSWSAEDQAEFYARLQRSRGDHHRAQYLRIQALCLAEAGNHPAALALLDQLFRECPHRSELAQAHMQKAKSLLALGREDEAIAEYRACLQAQCAVPTMQTQGGLDLAWLIVLRERVDLYDEAATLAEEAVAIFPAQHFRVAVVQALIADARGDKALAEKRASEALAAAQVTHSGLRHHANLGLVGNIDPRLEARLLAIGQGSPKEG